MISKQNEKNHMQKGCEIWLWFFFGSKNQIKIRVIGQKLGKKTSVENLSLI